MKKIIITIIIVLSAIAAIVVFIIPSFQTLRITKGVINQKQQEIKELTTYVSQIQRIEEQLKESEVQLEKIDQSLLGSTYLASVFQFIQVASSNSGVRIEKIELGEESPLKENKDIVSQKINLRISGDYPGLKNFLTTLENNSRLILITGVNFSGETASQDITKKIIPTMELNTEIFSYSNKL